jgi:hypothetical protein
VEGDESYVEQDGICCQTVMELERRVVVICKRGVVSFGRIGDQTRKLVGRFLTLLS